MKNRFMALALVLALVMALVPGVALAADPVAQIGDTTYENLADAFAYAKANDGSTITLLDDIDLSTWTPVNMDVVAFTLDGNNKTISNLPCALIDSITTGGKTVVIKDLTISEATNAGQYSNHSGDVNAGGLVNVVGYVNLTISNVKVENSTIGATTAGYAGGLIGYVGATDTSVLNIDGCSVTGSTITCNSSAGGLFGHSNGGLTTITDTKVGGNTIKGEKEAKEGALIGTLTSSVGTKIDVDETTKSFGTGTLNVVGRVYTEVTYTGGEYFTDPTVASATNDSTSIKMPDGTPVATSTSGKTIVGEDSIGDAVKNAAPGEKFTVDKDVELEDGTELKAGEAYEPNPVPAPQQPTGNNISVKYLGGNSFSTSKSAVPTGVEIDGVPVSFTGDGKLFTVSGIPAGAKWITVRWNSTSVTVNFTPNGAYAGAVEIPKTGDMSVVAYAVMAVVAAAGAMLKK